MLRPYSEETLANAVSILEHYGGTSLSTAVLTNSEYLALKGVLYRYYIEDSFTSAQARYYKITAPAGFNLEVVYRTMNSDISGVEYNKMAGVVATESATFYTGYEVLSDAANTTTIKLLNTPTNLGTIRRTPLFTGAGSGVSSRTVATGTADVGFDYIPTGTSAIIRIKNNYTATQRIMFELGIAFLPIA